MQIHPGSVVTGHDVQNPSAAPEQQSETASKDGGKCRRCGCVDPLGTTLKEKQAAS